MTGGNGMFIMMGILMVICYKAMPKLDEVQMAPQQQQPQRQ